jgi:hypothetical protein
MSLRRAAITVTAAIALTAAALAVASPASAATYTNDLKPGLITAYGTVGYNINNSVTLVGGHVVAYRSPAWTGTQLVTVTWRVWRSYSGWAWDPPPDSFSRTFTVYPGQYVDNPAWSAKGLMLHYATDLKVTYRTSTGVYLGSTYFDFVHQSDYRCATSYGCSVVPLIGQWGLQMF